MSQEEVGLYLSQNKLSQDNTLCVRLGPQSQGDSRIGFGYEAGVRLNMMHLLHQLSEQVT